MERTRPLLGGAGGAQPEPRPGTELAAPGLKVPELAGSLTAPIADLAEAPVVVAPGATVADTARAMTMARSSVALVGADAAGIVTDSDLRARAVGEGCDRAGPVSAIMTTPVRTLDAATPLYRALLMMEREGLHHVPVTRGGQVVGLVTERRLLRDQVRTPLLLLGRIEDIDGQRALEGYADGIVATVDALLRSGLAPARIGRVIASLNDALTARLLRLAEHELGEPPCSYAWLVLGSEGRMEQVLLSDQDNALAYATDDGDAAAYFARLAEWMRDALLTAGFPPCPGGYMAVNWRRSMAAWERTFRGWLDQPNPQALLEAEVFLDFRCVHGTLSCEPLERVLAGADERPLFLAQLARAATEFAPPLGAFGRLGARGRTVDLKRGGLAAIVLLGRLCGLAARSPARSTLDRLAAGEAARVIGAESAESLADAFRLLMRLRLREQLRAHAAGEPVGNAVRLRGLSPLERSWLRDAMRAIVDVQEATALRYNTRALA